jgi:DNA polymerase III delta prime subunit
MAVDWVFKYRPTNFDEMALYPALRKRLSFYAKTQEFSHLILEGNTGVGKTTAARILGELSSFSTVEEDCAADTSKERMLKVLKGTTTTTLFGTRRCIIMDEFHQINITTQTIFNKVMEDGSERNLFLFCVNDLAGVATPILSRALTLHFDVGIINPKTRAFKMFPYVDMSKEEWIDELKRVARIVAKKAGMEVSEEQLDGIAANDFYIVDTRKFLRAVEEQIKMDAVEN